MIIRAKDAVHVGLFASTGAGKNSSYITPNLLANRQNAYMLDPQGSGFTATAEHRRRRFGHEIARIDTSEICGPGGDGLNPLDILDPNSPTLFDDCKDIADMIVVSKGTEPDPHWDASAAKGLRNFIYYVAKCETDPARRNLLSVRRIVESRDAYLAVLNVMRQHGGLVKELADGMQWLQSDELSSVQSVLSRHINFLSSPIIAESLRRTTFDPMKLKHGRMTIYHVEHPSKLEANAAHLRLVLGTILKATTRGKASEASKVQYIIDETAALGRMKILENAICQLRGYGVRLTLTFQSIAQLQAIYGENHQTVLDNLTQIFFATRAYDSLEYISKLVGDTTITVRSVNYTLGHSHPTGTGREPQPGSASTSTAVTTSEHGRRWATASEIRTLPADMALVFHKNLPVIPARLEPYYASPLFRHGRTGGARGGLGLHGGILAAALLAASLLLSSVVASLPPAQPAIPVARRPGGGAAAGA